MTFTPEMNGRPTLPLVYVGRLRPDLSERPVETITDLQTTPRELEERLLHAPAVIVLDPLSFPWDSVDPWGLSAPFWLLLRSSTPEAESLSSLLGEPMLSRMTFFDRFITDSGEIGHLIVDEYGFARTQLTVSSVIDPGAVVEGALTELSLPNASELSGPYDPNSYWVKRGELMAEEHPAQAIGSIHHGLRENKTMHIAQSSPLTPLLTGPPFGGEWAVAEVGCGVARWAARLPRSVRYSGFDVSDAMLRVARENFPHHHFARMGNQDAISLPGETQDVVFTCTVLHHNPPRRRLNIIRSMFRALKVGGTLAFIESFVARRDSSLKATVYSMSVRQFMREVIDATGGNVVLRHVESLQYPYDTGRRGALIALTKLGQPTHL